MSSFTFPVQIKADIERPNDFGNVPVIYVKNVSVGQVAGVSSGNSPITLPLFVLPAGARVDAVIVDAMSATLPTSGTWVDVGVDAAGDLFTKVTVETAGRKINANTAAQLSTMYRTNRTAPTTVFATISVSGATPRTDLNLNFYARIF